MFGWFKRKKKKQEVLPPIHPHDLYSNRKLGGIGPSPRVIVVEDHSADMLTSPLYSYLPGNIFHHEYQRDHGSSEPAQPQAWSPNPFPIAADPTSIPSIDPAPSSGYTSDSSSYTSTPSSSDSSSSYSSSDSSIGGFSSSDSGGGFSSSDSGGGSSW
jgi:hypothetical protein